MNKKLLTILLAIFIFIVLFCKVSFNTVEDNTKQINKDTYYIYPFYDDNGDIVIPLDSDVCIITTDSNTKELMQKEFEELVIHYHKLLDPTHSYKGINNLKTINDNYGKDEIKVDKELIDILKEAIKLMKLSDGYFNPTIGILADIYKDRFNNDLNTDPSSKDINKALECTLNIDNIDKYLIIDEEKSTIKFNKVEGIDNIKIDLGAFSKGYVLDKAYDALIKYHSSFLISAGGSSIIAYKDESQKDLTWHIGIKDPKTLDSAFEMEVENIFLSTSGDYEQFYINEEGIRRHHILNPYSGYPNNYYRSISLIADKRADILDGLSTALFNIKEDELDAYINKANELYGIDISKAVIKEENENLMLTIDNKFKELAKNIKY